MRLIATVLIWLLAVIVLAGMMTYELAGNFLVALTIIAALEFVAILVHEAGHALAAKRLGAQIEVFAVLGFEYDFKTRKFGVARPVEDRELGGFVIYSWGELEPTRRDEALVAGAGPIANMLLALLALAMTLSLSAVDVSGQVETATAANIATGSPDRLNSAGLPGETEFEASVASYLQQQRREAMIGWFEGFAAVLAVLSLGVGLLNLLPYGGSDGERLLTVLSKRCTWPTRRLS